MAALPSFQIADFLPAALGFLGVYLLLPRPGSLPRILGAIAGLGAIVIAGWQLARDANSIPATESVLFMCFAGLALFGAVQLITQRNPARGAVAFALVVLSVCGLFLLHGAPFLAAGAIIIYAGAIVVTFLFVIMLCQQHGGSDADDRSREPLLACVAGALLLGVLFTLIRGHFDTKELEPVIAAAHEPNASLQTIDDALNRMQGHVEIKERLMQQLQTSVTKVKADSPPEVLATELESLRSTLTAAGKRIGDYPPPVHVAQSPFGGSAGLPAGNVAALGRVLFSDYLLAVEMAGTLLLVATIGTIAIAQRSGRKPA